MRLFDLISSKLGTDEEFSGCVRYTVLDEKSAYFQNVVKILEFSPSRIVLAGKKCRFLVVGECLSLESFYGKDLVVRGRITGVEKCFL